MQKPSKRVMLVAIAASVALILMAGGCGKTPVPPEIEQLPKLVEELRGAGAPSYLPEDFSRFRQSVADAELKLALQKEKFFLFRDLDSAYVDFKVAGNLGKELTARLEQAKNQRANRVKSSIETFRDKIETTKALTSLMNEGRLARRSLTKSEIAVDDAEKALAKGDYQGAEIFLANAEIHRKSAESTISKTVFRYLDSAQIERWRRTADAAIAESARTGGTVLVVLKLDRKLLVYKAGKLTQTYPIGIGKNGLADKLHVGDKATPEGRYIVSRKVPNSKFYKALLFNYPNEEDRQRFASAKKKGLIPRGRGIGGNVEIHGGGPDSVTEGCVSLDNDIMDKIYNIAGVGTPIVIVGTLQMNDLLTSVCRKGGA